MSPSDALVWRIIKSATGLTPGVTIKDKAKSQSKSQYKKTLHECRLHIAKYKDLIYVNHLIIQDGRNEISLKKATRC